MITLVGGSGFIGRHVAAELERRGAAYRAPDRTEPLDGRPLGDVVYCAGVTGDFRGRPLDTVASHVGGLEAVLRTGQARSIVYLSSTRLYRASGAATEDAVLALDPSDDDQLYDLSKAAGEALALSAGIPALVLRLANVYGVDVGSPNFLSSLLQDALRDGEVVLCTALDSTRNYVGVDDVVTALLALLDRGAHGVFNVAGERAVSHREVTDRLVELTGCAVRVAEGAPTVTAPDISVARLSAEIDYRPERVLDALPRLVTGYRSALNAGQAPSRRAGT